MTADFVSGPDWETTVGPIVSRQVQSGDLWPHGLASEIGGGNKDILDAGLHPVLAIGAKADRTIDTLTGVVVSFNLAAGLAQVNIAKGYVVRQPVANILTYNGGNPATWAAAYNIGAPVYLDDSADLDPGTTLSLSPLNSAGSVNPLVGWLFYDQDEYVDFGVGGPLTAAVWPKAGNAGATMEIVTTVLLK